MYDAGDKGQFAQWMARHALTPDQAARALGVTRASIKRYLYVCGPTDRVARDMAIYDNFRAVIRSLRAIRRLMGSDE